MQLEGVRRQLPRGLPHPRRASRADTEIDYCPISYRHLPLLAPSIRPDSRDEAGGNAERAYAPGTGLQEALYFWIFPNLMLNIYPDNISTNVIVPISTRKDTDHFRVVFPQTPDQPRSANGSKKAIAFSDEKVQQEDIGLCENVQEACALPGYDRGRYSVKRENGVHHFHMLLSEFLERP